MKKNHCHGSQPLHRGNFQASPPSLSRAQPKVDQISLPSISSSTSATRADILLLPQWNCIHATIQIYSEPYSIQNGVHSESESKELKTHTPALMYIYAFRIVTHEQRRVYRLHLYIFNFFFAFTFTCNWLSSFYTFTTKWQQQRRKKSKLYFSDGIKNAIK